MFIYFFSKCELTPHIIHAPQTLLICDGRSSISKLVPCLIPVGQHQSVGGCLCGGAVATVVFRLRFTRYYVARRVLYNLLIRAERTGAVWLVALGCNGLSS